MPKVLRRDAYRLMQIVQADNRYLLQWFSFSNAYEKDKAIKLETQNNNFPHKQLIQKALRGNLGGFHENT